MTNFNLNSITMMTSTLRFFLFLSLLALFACQTEKGKQSGAVIPSKITAEEGEQQASGYVFHDANNNQTRDDNETGISDVVVSNGKQIVITDADGHYSLPVTPGDPVFVVKPDGWMTPVNEQNLPRFHYIHKPEGSPKNFKYKGVEPTGDLPEEINFPLYKKRKSKDFKMVVFGDPQPYSIEQVDYVAEDIVNELIGRKDVKFGITMGDIVGDHLQLFKYINQAVSQAGIPWYNVMGNHDINYSAPTDELSDETFERVYGPANYAFVYGDVHFIILDDIIHESKAGSREYVGGLRPDQLTFVENYLRSVPKNDLVVLNMHIPLALHGKTFRQSDQKKLFALLKDHPNTLSISAHTHTQNNVFFQQDTTGWQQAKPHHHFNIGTTSGSWWNGMKSETDVPHTMMRDGTPNGYGLIKFNGSDYTIDWKVAGSPASHRMNIHVPRGIFTGADDNPLLTVNFFNGSAQSELKYRIKGETDWQKMEKTYKVDPYYAKLSQRWKNLQKLNFTEQWQNDTALADQPIPGTDIPEPDKSTHVWTAEIGTDFAPGRYTIEVKAKDRYGRTFTDYHTLRIATREEIVED